MIPDIQILFFDTKPYDNTFFEKTNKLYGFKIKYLQEHLTHNSAPFTNGYNVVCAFVNDVLDKKVIDILVRNKVRLIALRCAGYNNVDLKAANEKIHIVRVPGYSPHAVAEHTAGLMLSLNRKIHKAYYRTRDGNFSINGFLGFDLFGKTAGVIGTGKIGKCFISILKGFGMNVLAYDKFPDKEYAKSENFKYVTLKQIFAQADIISLHCPLTHGTHHLIKQKSIEQMKDGVMLLNTGRGALVNAPDLLDGLKSGKIGSAGLDVYEEESGYFFEDLSASMISDDILARLLTLPNVLITSHQGFFTREAITNIAKTTLSNIKEYFEQGHSINEISYKK